MNIQRIFIIKWKTSFFEQIKNFRKSGAKSVIKSHVFELRKIDNKYVWEFSHTVFTPRKLNYNSRKLAAKKTNIPIIYIKKRKMITKNQFYYKDGDL